MNKIQLAASIIIISGVIVAATAMPASARTPNTGGYADSGGSTSAKADAQNESGFTISGTLTGDTTIVAANSAATASANVDGNVFGGLLSATAYGANLSPITLDATGTKTMTGTSAAWEIKDARGTGALWNLTVAVGDFTSAAVTTGSTKSNARVISATNLQIDPSTFSLVADAGAGTKATGTTDSDPGTTSGAGVSVSPLVYSALKSDGTHSAVSWPIITGADSTAGTTLGQGAKGDYLFAAPAYSLIVPRNAYKSNVTTTTDGTNTTAVPVPYVGILTFTIA